MICCSVYDPLHQSKKSYVHVVDNSHTKHLSTVYSKFAKQHASFSVGEIRKNLSVHSLTFIYSFQSVEIFCTIQRCHP